MNPLVAAHRDGSRNPRRAGAFLDVIAVVTIVGGMLVAGSAVTGSGPGVIGFAVAAVVSGLMVHTVAIGMRWLAAMYELAAGSASESGKPVVTHRRTA